jgi:hypothetical protein
MFSNGLRLENRPPETREETAVCEEWKCAQRTTVPRRGGGPGLRTLSYEILGPRFRGEQCNSRQ